MGVDGVYGSRITGGGFGGCSVSLVRKDAVDALTSAIDSGYPAISGGKRATVFVTRAGPGARDLTRLLTDAARSVSSSI
jgi:galactokinase